MTSPRRLLFAIQFALSRRAIATWLTLLIASNQAIVHAGELAVTVASPTGNGVAEVVVTVASNAIRTQPSTNVSRAIMDQRNLEFLPRILVVAVGTSVEFPNNDKVSHQVYSFSPAKRFQLPLYKGEPHKPITFDRPGLVVLGCNIHDTMVGYIYVTDAPFFGKTDASGMIRFRQMPSGEYRVRIWSPFIADDSSTLTRNVRVVSDRPTMIHIRLVRPLRAEPEPRPRRREWEY